MTLPRGQSAADLRFLIDELMADGSLDEDDLARIAEATAGARQRVLDDKAATLSAHVHDASHAPIVTTDDEGAETVDATPHRCCDCGRELVSDAGTQRILVCPRVHGKRAPSLRPADPDGAVECGRA